MSNNLNINGSSDPSYRYKMPRVVGKIEGKGNGIKTVIVNAPSVARALKRPTEQLTKFVGLQVGASSRYDEPTDRYIVNGLIETNDLQKHIFAFIEKFVLCPKCGNPETVQGFKGKKKQMTVTLTCSACGAETEADNSHKLISLILKELTAGAAAANSSSSSSAGGAAKSGDGGGGDSTSGTSPTAGGNAGIMGSGEDDSSPHHQSSSGGGGEDGAEGREDEDGGAKKSKRPKKKKKSSSKKSSSKTGEEGEDEDTTEETEEERKARKEKKRLKKKKREEEEAAAAAAGGGEGGDSSSAKPAKPKKSKRSKEKSAASELEKTAAALSKLAVDEGVKKLMGEAEAKIAAIPLSDDPAQDPAFFKSVVAVQNSLPGMRTADALTLTWRSHIARVPSTTRAQAEKHAKLLWLLSDHVGLDGPAVLMGCIESTLLLLSNPDGASTAAKTVPLLLKTLFDTEVLDEGSIVGWYNGELDSIYPRDLAVRPDATAIAKAKALSKPLIEWMQEDEEEDEEDDEDEDDDDEEDGKAARKKKSASGSGPGASSTSSSSSGAGNGGGGSSSNAGGGNAGSSSNSGAGGSGSSSRRRNNSDTETEEEEDEDDDDGSGSD